MKNIGKASKTENRKAGERYLPIIIAVLALSLIIPVFAQDAPVCCCYPDGDGDLMPESECEYQVEEDVPEDLNCSSVCEEGYEPPSPPEGDYNCNDEGFEVPIEVDVSYVKGGRGVNLDWSSPCEADYYRVTRKCKNSLYRCETSSEEQITTTTETAYLDPSARWDTNYTYSVIGYYNIQGDEFSAEVNATVGDIECWYKESSNEFCVHESTYNAYREFLINEIGFREESFFEDVQDTFWQTLNRGFYCDNLNQKHEVKNCNQIGGGDDCDAIGGPGAQCSCVSAGEEVECALRADCEDENADPFGLYYQNDPTWCLGAPGERRYCFVDDSRTVVDKCYNCDTSMDCYDYKSQEACERDNCGFGNCQWEYTYPELGVGVCKNEDVPNCMFCTMNGTWKATNKEAYNNVYDECTQEKAAALSNEDYKCYFNGLEVRYCQSTLCIDYKTPEVCVRDEDPCGLGVCEWYGAEEACYKDTDNNKGETLKWMDCYHIIEEKQLLRDDVPYDEDFRACQADYFAPESLLTPSDFKNSLPRKLMVDITDKTSGPASEFAVSDYSGEGYMFHICVNNLCGSQTDYQNVTAETLNIHNLNLTDGRNYLYNLQNGENTIKYYARDPSNNIGEPKTLLFNASENATGPEIIAYQISPGRNVEGVLYSNNKTPEILVAFIVQPAEISRKDIYRDGAPQTINVEYTWQNYSLASLDFAEGLDDGSYQFVIDAIGSNGLSMDAPYYLNFTIDTTPPQLISTDPANGERLYSNSNINLEAEFDENVLLNSFIISSANYTDEFTTRNNHTWRSSRVYIEDGNKEVDIIAEDYATNRANLDSMFVINAEEEINISMARPSWGVSPVYNFDIELRTGDYSNCSYFFNKDRLAQVLDPFYVPFPETGQSLHLLENFAGIAPGDTGEYEFYVRCDDGYYDPTYKVFNISVDTTPPQITETLADPDVIIDADLNTTLHVMADEDVVCRYDDSIKTNYSQLSYLFDEPVGYSDFDMIQRKEVHVNSSDTRAYTYYVGCMDKAELHTQIEPIAFSVDQNRPFEVDLSKQKSRTNSSTIALNIITNKKARCSWGLSENTLVNDADDYGDSGFQRYHQGIASGFVLGQNMLYVRCVDMNGTLSQIKSKAILSDTTPPEMTEVNITSHHPNFTSPKMAPPLRAVGARFDAFDNQTPENIQYSYMLEEQFTENVLVNWTDYSGRSSVSIMELDNGSSVNFNEGTYVMHAKPRNMVGLEGNELTDMVSIDPTLEDFCSNGMFDNSSESDRDCGVACPPCADGRKCFTDADCQSNYCNLTGDSGICMQASCEDDMKNGLETDVDCGGDACGKCDLGQGCDQDSDCLTNNCEFGVCGEVDSCNDGELTLNNYETDVDCGGHVCEDRCSQGKRCEKDSDCEADLQCREDVCTACSDDDLDCDGIPNEEDDDIDGDGIRNWDDPDDDNDGLCDTSDSPLNDPSICEGEDDDDDGDGILDPQDKDTDNDLDNDGVENHLDEDIDGDGLLNDEDPDDDNDGIPDSLDDDDDNDGVLDRNEDDDNDGLSNEWEIEHGLDPNNPDSDGDGILDGDEDWDEDGLSNSREESEGTDPDDPDSDRDGWNDGDEVDEGTDPLDSEDKPTSYLWLYILLLIVLLLAAGGGYYAYVKYPNKVRQMVDKLQAFTENKMKIKLGKRKTGLPHLRKEDAARKSAGEQRGYGMQQQARQAVPKQQEVWEGKKARRKETAESKEKERYTLDEKSYDEDGWVTLGPRAGISDVFKRLESLQKGKLSRKRKVVRSKAEEDVFRRLEKMIGWKPSDDVMTRLKKIAASRKLTKKPLTEHLEAILKQGKIPRTYLKTLMHHLVNEGITSRLSAKSTLEGLAEKKLITRKMAEEIAKSLNRRS